MANDGLAVPDGSVANAKTVGFTSLIEDFNEYLTDDGVVIRVKHVVTNILVTDEVDEDGNNRYAVHSQMVFVTHGRSDF